MRISTEGDPPGPHDVVTEIPDPVAATRAHLGGDPDLDLWDAVTRADPVPGGLAEPLGSLEIAPPVRPGKIICVGRNFRAHAAEMGNDVPSEPLLFFKPASCLVASGDPVVRPRGFERVDLEGELVVVLGRDARGVEAGRALRYVGGYTIGNDVSNRDLQKKDKLWPRAKGADTFGPLGPFVRVVPPGTALPDSTRVRAFLDDCPVQDAPLGDMVFGVTAIIAYVSAVMTLEVGDLIFMGTPEGVAALQPGAVMRVEIDGLGRLTNPVV